MPGRIAEFREAIRLKPDYAVAHSNLGIALAARRQRECRRRVPRGDPPEARRRPGPLQPRPRPARVGRRARCDRGVPRGDPPQARRRLGPLQPRHRPAESGDVRGASRRAARRSASSPTSPRPTPTSALALISVAPGEACQREVRVAALPRGDPPQARPRRGPLQPRHRPGAAGDVSRCDRGVREAIRLKPDFAEAHCNLGEPCGGRGDMPSRWPSSARGTSSARSGPTGLPVGRVGRPGRAARRPGRPAPGGPGRHGPAGRLRRAPGVRPDALRREAVRRRRPALVPGAGGRPEAR